MIIYFIFYILLKQNLSYKYMIHIFSFHKKYRIRINNNDLYRAVIESYDEDIIYYKEVNPNEKIKLSIHFYENCCQNIVSGLY